MRDNRWQRRDRTKQRFA